MVLPADRYIDELLTNWIGEGQRAMAENGSHRVIVKQIRIKFLEKATPSDVGPGSMKELHIRGTVDGGPFRTAIVTNNAGRAAEDFLGRLEIEGPAFLAPPEPEDDLPF